MKMTSLKFKVTIFWILSFMCQKSLSVKKLAKFNVDPKAVTITGFSSGGAQAMQFHFAHSSKVSGVGIFSGVPYLYGEGRKREDYFVTKPDQFNVTKALEQAKTYEAEGLIDPLENIGRSSVYIYHGSRDMTVLPGSGTAIEKIYSSFGPQILTNLSSIPSDHGMPSDNYGGPCGMLNLFNYLVNNCMYNGVYDMFNMLYGGNLKKPDGSVGTVKLTGEFSEFDQTDFFPDRNVRPATMDKIGYYYIPSGCLPKNITCRLSFVLHGCEQSRDIYGDKFSRTTGFLEVAELNNIALIFPQTRRSLFGPRNPSGCWDWMGFTGPNYATREGPQVKAIKSMLDRILGEVNLTAKKSNEETS